MFFISEHFDINFVQKLQKIEQVMVWRFEDFPAWSSYTEPVSFGILRIPNLLDSVNLVKVCFHFTDIISISINFTEPISIAISFTESVSIDNFLSIGIQFLPILASDLNQNFD